jgi:hypothetical protein
MRTKFCGAAAAIEIVIVMVLALSVDGNAQVLTPGVNEPFNGGISSPSREVPRVMQSFIDNTFLSDVTAPTTLLGLSFRLPGSAETTYPTENLTFGRYEITLSEPSAAAAAANGLTSDTFAANMSNPQLVRAGPLVIPANSFTDNNTGPGPDGSAEFSYFIPFDTPYVINPGEDLVVLLRHSGYSPAGQTLWNFDSFTYTNGGRVSTAGTDATTGALLPDTVLKYAFVVPEPSGVALLGVAAVAALRRGRRRARAAA